jgi:hypothetical protein
MLKRKGRNDWMQRCELVAEVMCVRGESYFEAALVFGDRPIAPDLQG